MRKLLNRLAGPVLQYTGLSKPVFDLIEKVKNSGSNKNYYKQLTHVVKRSNEKTCRLPLFCCLRNEMHRIPFFLEYYRNLGVDHFFFIDNDSDDNFLEFMKAQEDCSVWHTTYSYKDSNFGMAWCNQLIQIYGLGKWAVTVDPDEFIVYPNIENRNMIELTEHMDNVYQRSLFTVMIDCYGEGEIENTQLPDSGNPFECCPYFDRYNYTQQKNENGGVWIQGGVRMRKYFKHHPEKAPAQNKVPLIKWEDESTKYLSSMHHTNNPEINCTIQFDDRNISGCLFHFKYISKLKDKVEEEMVRKEHYQGGAEYKKYNEEGFGVLYDENFSVKYEDSAQLLDLKLMHRGEWF